MVEVETKYNGKKKAAIITTPREILIKEKEYRAIQKLTGNQFGYFYITSRIILEKGSITQLDFSSLEIKTNELTNELENLRFLESLNLGNNHIKRLPKSLMNLKKLKELHLAYNQITSIPETISKLQSLEEIYLPYNPITSLPESITNMPSLDYLVISSKNLDKKTKNIIKNLKQKINVLVC